MAADVNWAQQSNGAGPHGRLPADTDCLACHTQDSWKPARRRLEFDHNASTSFVLLGRHEKVTCTSCHLDLRFDAPKLSVADCASCHVDVHQGRFVASCSACHNTVAFSDVAGMRLHSRTSFPLTGSHLQISCESCHRDDRGGAYTSLNTECIACHAQDYASAEAVDHVTLNFPANCDLCHSSLDWGDDVAFDHASASGGFMLAGAHGRLVCSSCHRLPGMDLIFPPPSGQDDCLACHQADYDRQHAAAGFPFTCLDCHGIESWSGASFNHLTLSQGFALLGAHTLLECSSCHRLPSMDLLFAPPAGQNDCLVCHQADYDGQHGGSGIPVTCLDCHSVESWGAATFDHVIDGNGFALVGAHAFALCSACHRLPGMELLFPPPADQNDCIACHQADYDNQHGGSGFPVTCQECHGVDSWAGATFDHALYANGFTLIGAHALALCSSCHNPDMSLRFPRPSSTNDCIACHQADYDTRHSGSGFPSTCLDCHSTDTWLGATFNHDLYFPIYTGRHSGQWGSCAICHEQPNNFQFFTCFNCHQHSQSRMDSQHSGESGYRYDSNACYSCHPNGRA
jgi:hypothetical protein